MAAPADFGNEASAAKIRRTAGVLANMYPATNTSSICMVKPSKPQKPSPHMFTIAIGVLCSTNAAATPAIRVNKMTKMYGSGK